MRDFFFTKVDKYGIRSTYPTDIVAVDYFATPAIWPYTSAALPVYLDQHKVRMDRAIAHLSFDRLTFDKKWDATSLLSEIFGKWFEFIAKLDQDNPSAASWFRTDDRAKLVPFSPPA
jgi:hypothetical protein